MFLKYISIVSTLAVLISCTTGEVPKTELSNPGFGVVETSIQSGTGVVRLPLQLNADQMIKGMQFTMSWDTSIAVLDQPQLTELNPGFSISSSKTNTGQMMVLIFSLTGDVLNTNGPEIMTIPVNLIDPQAIELTILFEDAIFAGPNARSHKIPITHAKLEVKHS